MADNSANNPANSRFTIISLITLKNISKTKEIPSYHHLHFMYWSLFCFSFINHYTKTNKMAGSVWSSEQ